MGQRRNTHEKPQRWHLAATVDLDPKQKYQFRDLADGINGLNDKDAGA